MRDRDHSCENPIFQIGKFRTQLSLVACLQKLYNGKETAYCLFITMKGDHSQFRQSHSKKSIQWNVTRGLILGANFPPRAILTAPIFLNLRPFKEKWREGFDSNRCRANQLFDRYSHKFDSRGMLGKCTVSQDWNDRSENRLPGQIERTKNYSIIPRNDRDNHRLMFWTTFLSTSLWSDPVFGMKSLNPISSFESIINRISDLTFM
jgi:hypothetical protein